jgi:hypothetical protein
VQILRETARGKRHDPIDLAKHAFRCKPRVIWPSEAQAP